MTLFGKVAQQVAEAAGLATPPGGKVPHTPTFRCRVCDVGWPDATGCPLDATHPGIAHDSAGEDRWYQGLVVRARAGELTDLRAHPQYPLVINDVPVATYTADATYVAAGQRVVADYKSRWTAKDPRWARTKKIFKACYPHLVLVEVVE